ncbi:MAG: DNA-directed RNA polymerase subunit A' [Hadesarchaea archaeon]|nr:MAG: DNA-directed RNA polymerase subunit A' [Hadesarchaea archaeon]
MRPQRVIESIRFSLLSPDEMRKMSVTRVVTADTYDEDGMPIERGLMDRRLGVVEPGLTCRTCGGGPKECPGHFGHIELARPVIHVNYVETILDLLQSTCRKCGRILLEDKDRAEWLEKMEGREDWWELSREVLQRAKQKKCPHCGEEQQEIKFEKPFTFLEGKRRLTPLDIRIWLERIRNEDLKLLGIDPSIRPEWMVLQVLLVPPVTVRPSITLETGVRSEDDLTHKLVDIIRINQRLAENMEAGAPHLIVEDLWELLQYHVATYFSNEISGVPPARHRSGRVLRTLGQRLKGKEGRFRGNLSGKRVDFSARAVISPDPCLKFYEVGVPEHVARVLTVRTRVTSFNLDEMRELVRRGPYQYPGAQWVISPDGRRYDLRYADREELAQKLEPGYVVERNLRDGDIVLFNRQPSLHRMSIMAHRVRVMPGLTFRLNLCVCPLYNADFDGDEMNLHVPQSEEAQVEAMILMAVQNQILSPRFGGPIIGGIQDHITGAYLLTRKDTLLDREKACQLLMQAGVEPVLPPPAVVREGREYWTGKQIFSVLLPKDLNLTYRAKICEGCSKCREEECEKEAYVVIRNGELKKGVIDAHAYKALDKCELWDRIVKEYGVERATEFLDQVTRLSIAAATMLGFTTSIDDEDIPENAKERIEEKLEEAKKRVAEQIEIYEREEMEPLPGRSLRETLEMKIMEILAEVRDKAGEEAERYLTLSNPAVIMARTGARGSMLNLTQMAACVGQQSVRGERLNRGYTGRVLIHFKPGDLGAEARGFVSSSYKSGLRPIEFFFHATGGREGLVDTAVRTAQSGYMQRRLINALQDLHVEYDGTVRDAVGGIVQFLYGEDGADPMRTDNGKAVRVERLVERVLGAD